MKSAIFLAAAAATTVLALDAPQGAMVDAVAEKELVARYKFLDGVAINPVGATLSATGSEVPSPSISLPPIFQETVTMTKVDIFYTTLTTEVNAATMTAGPGQTGDDDEHKHDDDGDHDDKHHDDDGGDDKDDDKHDDKGGDDKNDGGSKKKGGNKAMGGAAPFITNDPFVAASATGSAFGSASASASLKPLSSLGGAPNAGATRAPAGSSSNSNKVNKQAVSSATVARVSGYLMAGAAACAWFLL
ncbi:unnamed protein product [Umbelopsis ramanniana]